MKVAVAFLLGQSVLLVLVGRHVGKFLEDDAEVTLAAKPGFLGYIGDGFVCGS